MEYKLLTDEIKKLLQEAAEKIEIDVSELDTYEYHGATSPLSYYGPEPSYEEYDEDEYLAKQLLTLAEYCATDGYMNCIDFYYDDEDDERDEQLNKECIDYLETLAEQIY